MSSNPSSAQPTAYNCTNCQAGLFSGEYSCRKCGLTFATPVPAPGAIVPAAPSAVAPAAAWLAPDNTAALLVRLASGQEYAIQEILLFDQISLAAAANLKAQALEKFGGFQTGLGSIGSLRSVVTTQLVVGALEGVVSANMRQTAMKMLEQAERMALESRAYCYFFRPPQIFNVELAMPEMWQATLAVTYTDSRLFIHNGDPMVVVRLGDGRVISLLWDKVESFEQVPFH